VLIANASGTGQMGAVAKGQRLSGEARPDHPMRHARAVLEDLVLHVQPPKGYAIVLTERPFSNPSDPNWIATVGPMVLEYARRHTAKVAELRKTDLRIDWSEVIGVDGPRRIALRDTEQALPSERWLLAAGFTRHRASHPRRPSGTSCRLPRCLVPAFSGAD
jgi:hypothetical protein